MSTRYSAARMSHGFLRNTTIVGLLTLLSRVTGVIRDMVYLISFGAGPLMDAFLVAFKIPNFMRRLTAEGAFSQAFVPVISEYKVRKCHAEVRELVAGVSGVFGAAAVRHHPHRRHRGAGARIRIRAGLSGGR